MGQVYMARHRLMKRVVALKVIRQKCLDNPDAIRRFQREVQLVARLRHPNIVLAYDADRAGTTHFLVMEYVPGKDLTQVVKKRGPLPVLVACSYILQAARGLQHAHEHGLVHRDIKPANLIVDSKGVLKILDLGLARMTSEGAGGSTVTQEGVVLGTLEYMAPEQAQGARTVDIRGDLYSLGCTFYFLLTGQVPFPGGTMREKLARLVGDEPVRLTQRRPDVPPAVAAIVRKLMAKDPKQRYPEPATLADELTKVVRALRRPRRRILLRSAIMAGLLLTLAAIVFLAWPSKLVAPMDKELQQLLAEAKAPATQAEGFVSLFDGKTLAGWRVPPDDHGHWKVVNGVIDYDAKSEAKGEKNLWSEKSFKDFVLRIDWRLKDDQPGYQNKRVPIILPDGNRKKDAAGKEIHLTIEDLDSGIYLRGSPKSQVNIFMWPIGSGEVYGYRVDRNLPPEVRAAVTPRRKADRPRGQWNTFEIKMQGDRLWVKLNGEEVITHAQLPGVPAEGPIALQHHGSFDTRTRQWNSPPSLVQFRKVYVKELKN
jgi:tRNA A-37 threonylcarbamoyl transferase component Bud32